MIRLGGMVRTLREAFGRGEFISDFGKELIGKNNATGEKISIPRYGVWGDKGKGKPEVIESSNDLQYLLSRYNLSEKSIVQIPNIKNTSSNVKENTEKSEDSLYATYVRDRAGEDPFTMHDGKKFQFVQAKYPDGKEDIGVYAFQGDVVYGYKAGDRCTIYNKS